MKTMNFFANNVYADSNGGNGSLIHKTIKDYTKIFFATFLGSIFCNIAYAHVTYLDMLDGNDTHLYFPLAQSPNIKFSDGYLVVNSQSSEISVELSQLKYFKFIDKEEFDTGIKDLRPDDNIRIKESHVIIDGHVNESVNIYNTAGLLLESYKFSTSQIDIDLSIYPRGMYIINTSKASYKILHQ